MAKKKFNVTGMSCSHCENAVTNALKTMMGVKSVKADAKKGVVVVEFDEIKVSIDKIKSEIIETGYEVD